jgi:hypothetical protein
VDDIEQDITRVERRARRYWLEDGLAEVFSGTVFVLVGLYLALLTLGPSKGPGAAALVAGFPVLVIGPSLILRKLILAAKDRYVHPRTGYVRLPARTTHAWSTGILAASIAALIALLVNRVPFIVTWIPALLGLVLAVAFLVAGRRTNLTRFPAEGIVVVAAGLALSLQHVDENLAAGLLFAWVGLVMAAVGAVVFRRYLRRSPPPEGA